MVLSPKRRKAMFARFKGLTGKEKILHDDLIQSNISLSRASLKTTNPADKKLLDREIEINIHELQKLRRKLEKKRRA